MDAFYYQPVSDIMVPIALYGYFYVKIIFSPKSTINVNSINYSLSIRHTT